MDPSKILFWNSEGITCPDVGDFNLIYKAEDKNNGNLNRAMMGRFRRAAIAWKEIHMSFWTRIEGFMDEAAVDERRLIVDQKEKKEAIWDFYNSLLGMMVTEEEVEVYMIIFWTLERLLILHKIWSCHKYQQMRFSLVMCSSSPIAFQELIDKGGHCAIGWTRGQDRPISLGEFLLTRVPDVHIWKHLVATVVNAEGQVSKEKKKGFNTMFLSR
ncbi:hypothetical protein ACJX0J_022309, partial [Zea mays]